MQFYTRSYNLPIRDMAYLLAGNACGSRTVSTVVYPLWFSALHVEILFVDLVTLSLMITE